MFDLKQPSAKPGGPPRPGGPRPENPVRAEANNLAYQIFTRESTGGVPEAAGGAAVGPGGSAAGAMPGPAPYGVIRDDGAPLAEGQASRTGFLDAISAEIERVADAELAGTGRTARNCPYIVYWLGQYRERPAGHIERVIERYARPPRGDLESIRESVVNRVRTAVREWVRSGGRVLDIPEPVAASRTGVETVQRMAEAGAPAPPDAAWARTQLGTGAPLDGGVRARMEGAAGRGFGDVRIHTDGRAAGAAAAIRARAFTVGSDVAFAAGQYRPRTLAGDLVIAHELAHVAQQSGAGEARSEPSARQAAPLEAEANRIALGTVLALTGDHDRAHLAMPSPTRTGLRLQRCPGGEEEEPQPGPILERAPERTTETFEAGNVPGERPVSTIQSGGVHEFRFDGDGDQMKELLARIRTTAEWPGQRARTVRVEITQISSNTVRSADFQLDQTQGASGPVHVIIEKVTDGRRPTEISLIAPIGTRRILFYPPTRTPRTDTYRAELSTQPFGSDQPATTSQSRSFEFPRETTPTRQVFIAGAPVSVGGIWAVDAAVGAYGDRFRFTFRQRGPGASGVEFGIAVLSGGRPAGGYGANLAVAGNLSVNVLSGDGIRLSLDLNGDGRADLELFDRMYAPPDYDGGGPPSVNRNHDILAIGPSLPGGREYSYTVRRGLITAGSTAPGAGTFAAASNAQAVEGLTAQSQRRSAAEELAVVERTLTRLRREARDRNVISSTLFNAWQSFDVSMILIGELSASTVPEGVQQQAAQRARAFYDALADATSSATRGRVVHQTAINYNEFTGARYVVGQLTRQPTPGDDLVEAINQRQWDSATAIYRRLVDGLDRWVARQMPTPTSESEPNLAAQASYLVGMRREIGRIQSHRPVRIAAVFHPEEEYLTRGRVIEVPLSLYFWEENNTWHLADLTNPDNTFEDTGPVGTTETGQRETEPSLTLFRELGAGSHFPRGLVHYQTPGGRSGTIVTTGPSTLRRWLTYIGLGAAAIGLVLVAVGTAGAGAGVAAAGGWVLVGSGVLGGISAGWDLYETVAHGNTNVTAVTLDVAQIIAAVAGVGIMAGGRIIVNTGRAAQAGARLTGFPAVVAGWADRFYVPLVGASVAADTVTLAVFTVDSARQYEEIDRNIADPEAKRRALNALLGQLALTGGLTALSLYGTIPQFRFRRNLRIEYIDDVTTGQRIPVAQLAPTAQAETIATTQPRIERGTAEPELAAARQRHLETIRTQIPGAEGRSLAEVEELALRSGFHVEESRRVFDPLYSAATEGAWRNVPEALASDIRRQVRRMVDIMNDPAMSAPQRRAALDVEVGRLRNTVRRDAGLAAVVDFTAMSRAVAAYGSESAAGLLAMDRSGALTRNGQPAGTIHSLMEQVRAANNTNLAHGIDLQYVIGVMPSRQAGGASQVQILGRPWLRSVTALRPPELPPQLPALPPGAQGRYIVDVGAAESGYAIDLVPAGDRRAGVLVQTELASYATAGQARRTLGVEQAAPRQAPDAVVVFGDALQNLELLFGTAARGQGTRRLFLNNVNAHYTPDQYRRLAEGLCGTMGRGGRVEVQWDMSPEYPGGAAGSRGHIQGDLLRDAIRDVGRRRIAYEDMGRGIPYRYSIEASRRSAGTEVPPAQRPAPPDPAGPQGHRVVITFED